MRGELDLELDREPVISGELSAGSLAGSGGVPVRHPPPFVGATIDGG
jgi:hypothetical protein